jgi:outer membrane protein assembly factor BamA
MKQAPDAPLLDGKIVKEIRINDLRFTKPEIITRELAAKIGEPYTEENAHKDPERLDRLGLFSSIEVQAVAEGDGVVIVVEVEETFPYLPTLSLSVTDETGVSAGPGFKSLNLFGQDISFSVAARFGGATDLQLFFENPWFAGNHASYRVEYFYLDRFNTLDDFEERSMELNLRLGSYIGEHGRIGGKLGLLQMKSDVPGITLSADNRDRLPGLGFFIGYDSRDLWSNPHRGWWNEIEVMNRGGILGGDGDYLTFNIDIRRYQPIAERHTLAFFSLTTLQTGTVGIDIPVHQDFHLGGTNTIRGWGLNASVGKNQFINTAEYRYTLMQPRDLSFKGFTLYLGIQLADFGDFGIAWNDSNEFRAEDFIGGIGFGIRFLVPFLEVLRIDFAYGEPGQGLRSHFGTSPKPVRQRQRVR